MILFTKSMIKFEEETRKLNSLKAVFIKPRFCMRVFIVKNERDQDTLFNKKKNLRLYESPKCLKCNPNFANEIGAIGLILRPALYR